MNFYIVPPGSYQTQQLMKNSKKSHRKHSRSSGNSDRSLRTSLLHPLSNEKPSNDVRADSVTETQGHKGSVSALGEKQEGKFSDNDASTSEEKRFLHEEQRRASNKRDQINLFTIKENTKVPVFLKKDLFFATDTSYNFSSFLSTVYGQEQNDPIYYAKTRNQSIKNFRHSLLSNTNPESGSFYSDKSGDRTGHLYVTFRSRVKSAILKRLGLNKTEIPRIPEEIYQRFARVLTRESSRMKNAETTCIGPVDLALIFEKTHLDSDDSSQPQNTNQLETDKLIITKFSNEYTLLEHYFIQVIEILGNGLLVDRRTFDKLVALFTLNMKLENMESVKILSFNNGLSTLYSWYLALTLPFVRVFETNSLFQSIPSTQKEYISASFAQEYLESLDQELYLSYFRSLDLRVLPIIPSMRKAGLLRLMYGEQFHVDSSSTKPSPENFEYFSQSLDVLPEASFHLIHSRDLTLHDEKLDFKHTALQFYRILKKNGLLEIPILMPGSSRPLIPSVSVNETEDNSINYWSLVVTPMFSILSEVFGSENVQFSVATSSFAAEMNEYLQQFISLEQHETQSSEIHSNNLFLLIKAEKI